MVTDKAFFLLRVSVFKRGLNLFPQLRHGISHQAHHSKQDGFRLANMPFVRVDRSITKPIRYCAVRLLRRLLQALLLRLTAEDKQEKRQTGSQKQ